MISIASMEFEADMIGAFEETRISKKIVVAAIEAVSEVVEAIFDSAPAAT